MVITIIEQDYPILIDIWESAVSTTHDFLSKEDFLFYKSQLPVYFVYVTLYGFKVDNLIKGFLGVSDDKIEMLFVHDNFRGSGVGKELLEFAINNLNIKKVDVNEQNTQALDFYKYFGFTEIGRSEYDSDGKNYPILYLQSH